MWNLVMGALVSSEEEGEENENNPKTDLQVQLKNISDKKAVDIGLIVNLSQDTPMVHSSREPSPGWILNTVWRVNYSKNFKLIMYF